MAPCELSIDRRDDGRQLKGGLGGTQRPPAFEFAPEPALCISHVMSWPADVTPNSDDAHVAGVLPAAIGWRMESVPGLAGPAGWVQVPGLATRPIRRSRGREPSIRGTRPAIISPALGSRSGAKLATR